MIEQQGRIIRVEAGKAWVAVGPSTGCSACEAGRGCGAGLFARLLRRRPMVLEMDNRSNLPVGRPVILGIPEGWFLQLVLRLYAWPLVAGLAGAWLSHQIGQAYALDRWLSDLFTLLGLVAAAALVLSWQSRRTELRAGHGQLEMSAAEAEAVCVAADSQTGEEF